MVVKFVSRKQDRIALLVFFVFYVGFGVVLALVQESIVYQPGTEPFERCLAFAAAEKITFEGTRMYFKNNGPKLAIIYHGNAGTACDRVYLASLVENRGYSYLVPEYTGYAGDGGSASHAAIKTDTLHVVDFVKERNFEDVTVIGESIGTGVAAYHTSLYPPESLLLISPFSDLVAIAARHYWYYPVSLLVNNAFDNEKLLRGYKGRVLIVHGEADTIIPAALGEKLFHSLDTSDRKLFIVPGAGHNDIFEFPFVDETLSQFMK